MGEAKVIFLEKGCSASKENPMLLLQQSLWSNPGFNLRQLPLRLNNFRNTVIIIKPSYSLQMGKAIIPLISETKKRLPIMQSSIQCYLLRKCNSNLNFWRRHPETRINF